MNKKLCALAVGSAVAAAASMAVCAEEYKVGIVQFVEHASLNQITEALTAQLDSLSESTDNTYSYVVKNGQADGTLLNQIGAELIDSQVDLIVAIATPAAQIMQSCAEDTEIPIVFSAVTDPVGAKLVDSMELPGGKITGTSDALDTVTMMKLITDVNPEAKTVGLLYSNSEDASKQPIEEAKAYLDENGLAYVEKTGTSTDEINQAVDALIADGVDAIFTPTDNTIMSAELSIFEKLAEAGIPHYCGADSFALNGAFLGFGVNYVDLGTSTADMVAEILGGADPAETPVVTFDNGIATINTETAEAIGIDLEAAKEAMAERCSGIVETTTAKEFE